MAVNLHEICRLCLEEIKTPSATLKEGSGLLTKIRRFLPVVKPFFIRKDDVAAADTTVMNVAGSSYQDGIECAVGVHLLAPLGISNLSTDNKHTEAHGVVFPKSEEEHSSPEHEKDYEDKGHLSPKSDKQVHSCGCVKNYKSHHFLDIHRNQTHLKEKPYMCAYCGQSFRYMSSLTRHLVIHSGEKRYVCHICNKAFTQEAHLKTHSILHTGEKPFHCTVCPMAFSRKGNLKRHLLVHKGDK